MTKRPEPLDHSFIARRTNFNISRNRNYHESSINAFKGIEANNWTLYRRTRHLSSKHDTHKEMVEYEIR